MRWANIKRNLELSECAGLFAAARVSAATGLEGDLDDDDNGDDGGDGGDDNGGDNDDLLLLIWCCEANNRPSSLSSFNLSCGHFTTFPDVSSSAAQVFSQWPDPISVAAASTTWKKEKGVCQEGFELEFYFEWVLSVFASISATWIIRCGHSMKSSVQIDAQVVLHSYIAYLVCLFSSDIGMM